MHCYNLISRNSKTSFCASAAPCEQAPRWLCLAYAADSRNKYREPLRYDACIFNCSDAQLNMQEYRSGHNEAVLKICSREFFKDLKSLATLDVFALPTKQKIIPSKTFSKKFANLKTK